MRRCGQEYRKFDAGSGACLVPAGVVFDSSRYCTLIRLYERLTAIIVRRLTVLRNYLDEGSNTGQRVQPGTVSRTLPASPPPVKLPAQPSAGGFFAAALSAMRRGE